MCEGAASAEYLDVESIKRCVSSPSLAVPQVTRKVPPVPVPRRKSASEECQHVNNLQNCATSATTTTTTTSGVSQNLELSAGMKAESCHDTQSLCVCVLFCISNKSRVI